MRFVRDVTDRVEELAKVVAFRTPGLRRLAGPSYRFGLEPAELAWLVDAIDATRELGLVGAVVEIGVARGMTTTFLNEHLTRSGDPRPYVCVDTFSGFTPGDIEFEVSRRRKAGVPYTRDFSYNDPRAFARNMARLGYRRVRCIDRDVATLRPDDLGAVSVALVDVDLYLPSRSALDLAWSCLEPGGRMLVDDVAAGTEWDGARQALDEFVAARGSTWVAVGTKGGAMTKPAGDDGDRPPVER